MNDKVITKLYKLADGLTEQINYKLNPACGEQNYTDRRARMAAQMRKDGENLEKIQYVLRELAFLHETDFESVNSDNVDTLKKLTTKKMVEYILLYSYSSGKWNPKKIEQLKKIGINNENQFVIIKDVLKKMLTKLPDRTEENQKIELENKAKTLIRQIPGFFPTPKKVATELVELAEIESTDKVLEPSAGSGNIAEIIREFGIEPDVIEWNVTLTNLLKLKGFSVIGDDFLECNQKFDKIIMNPPFEKMQDIDHVKHAYKCLNNGGRLVSVMSHSPFNNNTKKAREFRGWFVDVGGEVIDLPSGSFKESLTGVSSLIVVIDKVV